MQRIIQAGHIVYGQLLGTENKTKMKIEAARLRDNKQSFCLVLRSVEIVTPSSNAVGIG